MPDEAYAISTLVRDFTRLLTSGWKERRAVIPRSHVSKPTYAKTQAQALCMYEASRSLQWLTTFNSIWPWHILIYDYITVPLAYSSALSFFFFFFFFFGLFILHSFRKSYSPTRKHVCWNSEVRIVYSLYAQNSSNLLHEGPTGRHLECTAIDHQRITSDFAYIR